MNDGTLSRKIKLYEIGMHVRYGYAWSLTSIWFSDSMKKSKGVACISRYM